MCDCPCHDHDAVGSHGEYQCWCKAVEYLSHAVGCDCPKCDDYEQYLINYEKEEADASGAGT